MRPYSLALLALVLAASPARAERAGIADRDSSSFTITRGGQAIGREDFLHYTRNDTVFSYSTVRLDGLPADSPMPFERRTTYLQRRIDSYPMYFETIATARDSTPRVTVSCVFSDTTVMVYRERMERGIGTGLALPPGRLYLIDPGVYHPVQAILADFLEGKQLDRRQQVFIPVSNSFVTVTLTRGIAKSLRVAGRLRDLTSAKMSDGSTEFVGWIDPTGRMWRLEALGAGLVVERVDSTGAAPRGSSSAGTKKGARSKRNAPRSPR